MKLPCCLVGEHGEPIVGRHPHDAVKRRGAAATGHHPLSGNRANMFGLALLFASIFSDLHPTEPTMAISKSITTSYTPSALYQLASFMAMQDEEEEARAAHQERLMRHAGKGDLRSAVGTRHSGATTMSTGGVSLTGVHVRSAGGPSVATATPLKRHHQQKVTVRATLAATGTLSRPLTPDGSASSACGSSSSSGAQAASSSSSTATMALSSAASHRSAAASVSDTGDASFFASAAAALGNDVVVMPPSTATTTATETTPSVASVWAQIDVMDAAQEVGHNHLIDATHHMLAMGLFPTIYRAYLGDVPIPTKVTAAGGGGGGGGGPPSSDRWVCPHCAKRHDAVREACIRCGAQRPDVVKLFFGQLRKEAMCDDVLLRVVCAATSGAVAPLRVEGHTLDRGRRGKGCGSVYVTPHDADVLVPLLHRNVFLDLDWSTGQEVIYFAYPEQRPWLERYAAARIAMLGSNRPCTLPNKLLVCEASSRAGAVAAAPPPTAHYGGATAAAAPWQQQQRPRQWAGGAARY